MTIITDKNAVLHILHILQCDRKVGPLIL